MYKRKKETCIPNPMYTPSKVFQCKVHMRTSPLASSQHVTCWFHLLLLKVLSAALAASSLSLNLKTHITPMHRLETHSFLSHCWY